MRVGILLAAWVFLAAHPVWGAPAERETSALQKPSQSSAAKAVASREKPASEAQRASPHGAPEKPAVGVTKGLTEAKPMQVEVKRAEPTRAEGAGAEVTSQDYGVAPGDQLEIIVYPEEDLNRTLEVNKGGEISFPLLGKVMVAGLKVHAVEEKLQSLLAADYLVEPVVTVRVAQYHSRIVVVLGEVKRPGTYDFASEERLTLMGAVAMAGGFTDLAAVSKVKVVRVREGKEQTMIVNAAEILNGKVKDLDLEPNDLIIVPESFF